MKNDRFPNKSFMGYGCTTALHISYEKLGLDEGTFRSSRPEVFCEKNVLKNFPEFKKNFKNTFLRTLFSIEHPQ